MTVIRAKCPTCGEVDLAPEEVRLTVARGDTGSTYAFDCPECGATVTKAADRRTVAILLSAGIDPGEPMDVDMTPIHREDVEPMGALADAPPFTMDDLIDFHFLLLDDVYIEECLDLLVASRG